MLRGFSLAAIHHDGVSVKDIAMSSGILFLQGHSANVNHLPPFFKGRVLRLPMYKNVC